MNILDVVVTYIPIFFLFFHRKTQDILKHNIILTLPHTGLIEIMIKLKFWACFDCNTYFEAVLIVAKKNSPVLTRIKHISHIHVPAIKYSRSRNQGYIYKCADTRERVDNQSAGGWLVDFHQHVVQILKFLVQRKMWKKLVLAQDVRWNIFSYCLEIQVNEWLKTVINVRRA